MKKKLIEGISFDREKVRKIWMTMRLIVFLFFVSLIHVSASVYSQKTKLNIRLENASLQEVFQAIQQQSEFDFFYKNEQIPADARVSIQCKDEAIEVILTKVLNGTGLTYHLLDKDIVISTKSDAKNENLIEQQKSVSGKVTDSSGATLPGVSVVVKGTTTGTITDGNGNYSLSNVPENATLQFSFVGMKTEDLQIEGRSNINVKMIEESFGIDEVVAIGYGSQSKKEVTGAVTGVKYEDFNKGSINSPAQLLQGKVAGLNIVAPQGNPNGDFAIRLRGLSTLGANTQPLVIIDGVIGADLNSVDPNDIAGMDVLKDGGAAAIYGTRGSSGVILITTKTGIKGKTKVEYNGYITADSKDRIMPVMNKDEYLANGGTDLGGNTNWMDEITRTAISNVQNLSLSGGTDQTIYRISLNYREIQGVMLNTGYKQLNSRVNLTQKALNDRLTLSLNLAMTSKDAQLGFDDAFRCAIIMPPTAPIKTEEPYFFRYGGYFQSEVLELYNPVGIVKQNINDQKTSRLMYNLQADYKILDNLTASLHYARNNDDATNGQYISKYSRFGAGVDRNGLASRSSNNSKNDLFEATGNYVESFNKLNLVLLGGYSYQNSETENFYMQGGNFLTDAFLYNNFAASKDFADGKATISSSKESNKLIAFFLLFQNPFRSI